MHSFSVVNLELYFVCTAIPTLLNKMSKDMSAPLEGSHHPTRFDSFSSEQVQFYYFIILSFLNVETKK